MRKPNPPRLTLSHFERERQILSTSPHWQTLAQWQRDGLLRLRWEGSRDCCYVSLTAKGHDQISRSGTEPEKIV